MAANYTTGTASNVNDLHARLVAFLQQQGWSTLLDAAAGAGRRAHLVKGEQYLNLRAINDETGALPGGGPRLTGLGFNVGSGYDAAASWYAQPGTPAGLSSYGTETTAAVLAAGSTYAYHFFDDGTDNVLAVVHTGANGEYAHIGFGTSIEKLGNWSGGGYFLGSARGSYSYHDSAAAPASSQLSTFVHATVDTSTGWLGLQAENGRACSSSNLYNYEHPHQGQLGTVGVSVMSGQANLLPINLLAARDGGGWSYLGSLPGIYRCDAVGQGFTAGSVYTVGGDSYVLFPGFAVRKHA